jgi:hypothetical protein
MPNLAWYLFAAAISLALLGTIRRLDVVVRIYAFIAATLAALIALLVAIDDQPNTVFYLLAVVPALLIAQHAVYLAYMKNPFASEGRALKTIDDEFLPTNFENGLSQARRTSERYFSWSSLSFRFGVPAVMILLLIGLFARLLFAKEPPAWMWQADFVRGARYGAAGAYVYVLLYLTRRNFQHDITSGAASWAAADLVLGPLLGGVVALLWKTQGPITGFGSASVFFAAGLIPRHMAAAIEEAAKRLLRSPDDKSVAPAPRTIATTFLRGVTREISERLEEEGIDDVNGMAMADPARLMRNTSFDQRQIVSWIDEAILMIALPDHWEKLEKQGVTGAIDLAWYYDALLEGTNSTPGSAAPAENSRGSAGGAAGAVPAPPTDLIAVAKLVGLEPDVLWTSAQRFYWDGQVQLIWVLYQIGSEGVQDNLSSERSAKN